MPACRWLQHATPAVPPSLASVCLQLPEANRNLPYPPATEGDRGATDPGGPAVNESRTTWRAKLRSLLCCLAPPSNDQYFRSSETEAVVIRPLQPPTPPRYTGEAAPQVAECWADPGQQASSPIASRYRQPSSVKSWTPLSSVICRTCIKLCLPCWQQLPPH